MQIQPLPEVTPPMSDQERSPGLHLTDILNARAKKMGEQEYKEEAAEITETRFALGFAWELAIERALNELWVDGRIVRIGEVECDGVLMTPDAYDIEDRVIEEWKCSRLSAAKHPESYYRYITQQMCYCHALSVTQSRLRVLHLNGDYREMRYPLVKSWLFTWTPDELARNWEGLIEFAEKEGLL